VFSGGVGEHSDLVRTMVADGLRWIGVAVRDGIDLDDPVADITASSAAVRTLVVHAREDLQMLAEAKDLVSFDRSG
jgi:acetate kinase